MVEFSIEILVLFIAGIISNILVRFIKSFVDRKVEILTAKDLTSIQESVKKEFSIGLSREIEPLKAHLSKNNIEFQIQYSHLHQKRAEIILELYQKLMYLYSSSLDFICPFHFVEKDMDKEEKIRVEKVEKSLKDLNKFYQLNKLFFQESFCILFVELIDDFKEKLLDYNEIKQELRLDISVNLPKEHIKQKREKMNELREYLKIEISKKINLVEKEFRILLYVN